MDIILQIKGILENKSSFAISQGVEKRFTEDYPFGRNIRGAFGYLAKDLGLAIKDIFPDLKDNSIIFRDAIPLCYKCLEPYLPDLKNSTLKYICAKCNQEYLAVKSRSRTSAVRLDRTMNSVNNFFNFNVIFRPNLYRFKVLLNMKKGEKLLEDLLTIILFIQENGLFMGRRHAKGLGHFALKEFKTEIISLEEIKRIDLTQKELRIKLISDTIFQDSGFNNFILKPEMVKDSIQECLKFYNLEPQFDIDLTSKNTPLYPPVQLSLLNYLEDTNNFKTIETKAARRGITYTFETKRYDDRAVVGLSLLTQGFGIGRYIGLGQGEIYIG